MIVYNVTVKIDIGVHQEWLNWMKEIHIPEVMNTGCFESYKFFRLMEQDEQDGITYSIQYFIKDMETYFRYQKEEAPKFQKDHSERYKDKFIAFRTIMRLVAQS